jgi:predicted flap endonuclease-1-like 5' DNA nuclease
MKYTFLMSVCDITLPLLLLGMLIPAILGYLLRHFLGGKSSVSSNANLDAEWSSKYAKLEADYNNLSTKWSANSGIGANVGNLEAQVKKLQGTVSSYEGDMKRLRGELDTANGRLKGFADVDVQAMKLKISALEGEKISLQNNLTSLSGNASSLEDAQAQANALRDKFAHLETENAHLKTSLENVEREKNNIVRSEENLVKYKEEVREMSGKIGGYKVESDRLKQEAADAHAAAKAATESLENLKSQLATAQGDDAQAAAMQKDYEGKLASLQAQLNDANTKAANAASLQADLSTANAKLQETELNLSSAKLRIEQAAAVVPVTVEKIVEVEKRVEVPVEKIVEKTIEVSSPADKMRIAELEAALTAAKATPIIKAVAEPVVVNVAKADDLLIIEGIGPKVNELFAAKGVTTFAQLAAMSKEEVAAVLEGGGSRFKILNGNSWPKQAELLRDGKMEEFNAYTDYLIAGVDPKEANTAIAADIKPDDLKIVEGIGPKIEQLLNADGIFTFDQLAKSTYSQIKDVLNDAGPRYQMHDPSTWAEQAALARDGKMDALKVLQDNLKGGKA